MEDLSCKIIVDAHEGRNVDFFDVPRAYLHAEMPKDKKILMNLGWDFFDIIGQVNTEYEQNVRYENDKMVLYILDIREIYGCIET